MTRTSALSAATLWIPNTRLSDTVGSEDTPERAALYLDNAVGNRAPKPLRSAFLKAGPEAVAGFRQVLEAMMDPDMRRKYHAIREADT